MSWPVVAAAVISAASSLYGGKKDREAIEKANAANTPTAQVKAWESAGINPIMGLTQAQYVPQQAALIGDSFANAGNALANGMNILHDDQVRETAVFKENEKLREALDDATKPRERSHLDSSGPLLQQSGETDASDLENTRLDSLNDLYRSDDLTRLRDRNFPVFGSDFNVSEDTAPAQVFEDEYGDAASWIYGIGKLGVDTTSAVFSMPGINARSFEQNPSASLQDRNRNIKERISGFEDIPFDITSAFRSDLGLATPPSFFPQQ